MKIVFLTASMVGGGTERVIAILSNYFIMKNYDVEIVLTADDKVEYELDKHIVVTQLTKRTMGSILARINRIFLLREHMKNNKDAVYLSFGTETNLFAIVASMFKNTNLILSERSNPYECDIKGIRNFLYSFGKYFVFQTEDARCCFSKKIQKKGCVIPNSIPQNIESGYEGVHEKTIVSIGRFSKEKNHKLLISAFNHFLKNYPEYKLLLYGKGYLEQELREYVEMLGIECSVRFMGFSHTVMKDIKNAGMYVLASNYEGISNSLLEAMAMGLPVISTDCPIGGSRMLIEDGVNGLLVPVGNCEAMVQAMNQIAEDSMFADKLGNEAVKVRETYSVECICKMWEELVH